MVMLRHYLDGILIDEPFGITDLRELIVRDEERRYIGTQYEGEITVHGAGYDVLRTRYIANFCGLVPYRVEQQCDGVWSEAFRAVVVMTDVRWEVGRCAARVVLSDDNYGAYVVSNGDIRVRPGADRSKTGQLIDPATPISVAVFDPAAFISQYINLANTDPADPWHPVMWDWRECLSHLLRYISDGAIVGVLSTWYDNLPIEERYAVTSGFNLRTPATVGAPLVYVPQYQPQYSFNDLWQTIAKAYDLFSAIERDPSGDYYLRVERREYFSSGGDAVTHDRQDGLIQGHYAPALFGRIEVGSDESVRGVDTNATLPFILLRSFSREQYHVPIQCNTEASLDLVAPLATDSNIIERCVMGNVDDYDTTPIVVQYIEGIAGRFATKGDYILPGGAPYLYNEQLLNERVLQRYTLLGAVIYADNSTAGFRAELTDGGVVYKNYVGSFGIGDYLLPATPEQHRFNDDFTPPNEDPGNNYGNGTTQGDPVAGVDSRYTAVVTGLYRFEGATWGQIFANFPNAPNTTGKRIRLRVNAERYDSGGTPIDTPMSITSPFRDGAISSPDPIVASQGDLYTPWAFESYMSAGDYIEITTIFEIEEAAQYQGSPMWDIELRLIRSVGADRVYWRTTYVEGIGGDIIAPDLQRYLSLTFNYNRRIDGASWDALRSDLSRGITVGPDPSVMRRGYLRSASRRVIDGQAEIELIATTTSTMV